MNVLHRFESLRATGVLVDLLHRRALVRVAVHVQQPQFEVSTGRTEIFVIVEENHVFLGRWNGSARVAEAAFLCCHRRSGGEENEESNGRKLHSNRCGL